MNMSTRYILVIATAGLLIAASETKRGDVTEARVIAEASTGNDWLVGGRTFDEQHFSPLKQITDQNIGKLGLAWATDIESAMGLATEPIVVDGVIYVSAPQSRVYAVDALSGKVLWRFDPKVRLDRMRNSWAAHSNRGLAVWAGKVYVGTGDCRLVAIDAASRREGLGVAGLRWLANRHHRRAACRQGQSVHRLQRFGHRSARIAGGFRRNHAVKKPGDSGPFPAIHAKGFESKALEMAAKTWSGDKWWEVGGGDVWDPITYDPGTGLVIFGTAGAEPETLFGDKADKKVGGDRLFAGSVIAVNADTGEYVWHFQTSAPDFHTENMHILLADMAIDGQKRRVAITAPKNGFVYVLDEKTGSLLEAKPVAKVSWATSIDLKTGRPVETPRHR